MVVLVLLLIISLIVLDFSISLSNKFNNISLEMLSISNEINNISKEMRWFRENKVFNWTFYICNNNNRF